MTLRVARPSLLVNCSLGEANQVANELAKWCAVPLLKRCLPGSLELPSTYNGTLLLTQIEELSLGQQIALFDWMTAAHCQIQVVSIATTRIDELVKEGRFLEALFYRLNVVQLEARTAGLHQSFEVIQRARNAGSLTWMLFIHKL